MTPSELDLELELSQHAGALRAMARDLVRNEHTAEDVVQETVLSTLRQPPARPGSLGGWLVTVLRNLCFQHRRQEQRRLLREQLASRAERLPAAAELVERREILRGVTDSVLALREPYQTAILLRYFEGLSPRQIAARTDTSLATVKSRLQRGLALLREQLDRGHRGRDSWQKALLAATGLNASFTTKAALIAAGVTLMGPIAKLSIVAVAVVASTALVWSLAGPNTPDTLPVVASREDGPAPAPAATHAEGRKALATPATESRARSVLAYDLDHPFPFELDIQVIDNDGLPVAESQLQLAPAGCSLSAWSQRTGPDGVAHVAFRGKQPALDLVFGINGTRALGRVALQSGNSARIVIGGAAPARSRFTLRLDAKSIEGFALSQDLSYQRTPVAASDLHPFAVFEDAPPSATTGVRLAENVLFTSKLDVSARTTGMALGELVMTGGAVLTSQPVQPNARIEGTVFGEDGKPVPQCTVIWGTAVDRPSGRTQTDEHGAFKFDRIPVGSIHLRAGGGDGGMCRADLMTSAEQVHHWDPRLLRGTRITGTAFDQDGKPLAGWTVEFVGAAQPWFDECTVHADGSFELPNQPGGMGSLFLWSKDRRQQPLPMLVTHSVRPDNGPVQLRLDRREAAGSLELDAVLSEGTSTQPMLRVWQDESDRGAVVAPVTDAVRKRRAASDPIESPDRRFRVADLPAGWYHVEIQAGFMGWVEAGRHWVDGRNLTQLGRVAIPAPGQLRILGEAPAPGTESQPAEPKPDQLICLRRPDCDVRTAGVAGPTPDVQLLPAGDYWFLWRDASGTAHHRPFTIRSGGVTVLERKDASAGAGR